MTSPTSGGRSVGIVRSRAQTMEFSTGSLHSAVIIEACRAALSIIPPHLTGAKSHVSVGKKKFALTDSAQIMQDVWE
jgi:hypothetical protein